MKSVPLLLLALSTLVPVFPVSAEPRVFFLAAAEDARTYFNQGRSHFDQAHYSEAIAAYTQAIKLDPKYALAYNNRGYTYKALGQSAKAAADFAQASKLDPTLKH